MQNAIHMLKSVTNVQMNSFAITMQSGHVVLVDGGFDQDAEYLISYLREITGQERPHVDAWILTHPHIDHISAFMTIVEEYPDAIQFDRVLFNFPSIQFVSSESRDAMEPLERFYRDLPRFADKIVICSGGDRYDFGEAHFDILCSADSALNVNVCNNSCLVFRLELGKKTALFLADCGEEEGDKLLSMWDLGKLSADICQMAHHGQAGVKRNFYEVVRPETCIWCAPDWLWNNDAGKGYDTHTFKTILTRGWMDQMGATRHVVLKDGTQTVLMD